MGSKMGLSNANLFAGFIAHQFFSQYYCPEPELHGRYIDDCIGITSSIRKELNQFITTVNSFHPAHKYIYWQISDTFSAFLDIKISKLKAMVYALVFTTNLQTHQVTCCIHLITLRAPPPMSFTA